MRTEPQQLLHITHARQDQDWVHGVLVRALGLTDDQVWTREDDLGGLKLEEMERAVKACRYTLLVASSAARVDQWAQFAAQLAEHLGVEEGKPRLLLVALDFDPTSERARELLTLGQRCLVCLDCSDPARTATSLEKLAAQLKVTTTPEPPTECPYPGLRMFGEGGFNRTDLFFGRDEEGRAIIEKLRGGGRVLLVGPSGCGKSSLVRARVLPALGHAPDAMAIAVTHPGTLPDVELREALDRLDPRLGPATDAYLGADDKQAALAAFLAAVAGPRRLLYLDQLEEVFLDDADERGERARFFARLAALGRVPGLAILLGMRADFYGDLMRSPAWEDFKDHRVELAPLRGAALRLAITRPAEAVGVYVEADLVERLVREADQDRAAEALPLLQVALVQLWALREWRYLSLASYAGLTDGEHRGLDVVLARHADDSIGKLAEPMQVLARRVLVDLVNLGEGRPDTRRRRTESELRRAGDDGGALAQVIDHLSARRLIAVSAEVSMSAERYVDLAHDTLITGWPALAGWISNHRDALRTQRRLEARAAGGGLLAASELPEFSRWVAWIATPAGQALGASEALRKLVRRSVLVRRIWRIAFGVGFVVAVTSALVFWGMTLLLREEQTRTQQSISKAAETAEVIVGEIDFKLRRVAGARSVREALLKRSRELLGELRKFGDLDERAQRTTMITKLVQGDFALEHGHLDEAQALYLETLGDVQQRAAANPANTEWQVDLATSYQRLGDVAMRMSGKLEDARQWFEKDLAVMKTMVAVDPANIAWQVHLAASYRRSGDLAMASGNLDVAAVQFEESLAVSKALADTDLANLDWQHELSVTYFKLGNVAKSSGNLEEEQVWFDRSLTVSQMLTDADPANTMWQGDLASAYTWRGNMMVKAGRLDDARSWFDKSLAVNKALADADPGDAEAQLALLSSHVGVASTLASQPERAAEHCKQATAIYEQLRRAGAFSREPEFVNTGEMLQRLCLMIHARMDSRPAP